MGDFLKSKSKTEAHDPFKGGTIERAIGDQLLMDLNANRAADVAGIFGPVRAAGGPGRAALGRYGSLVNENMPALEDLFASGVAGIGKTASGAYLDPMKNAPYRRFARSVKAGAEDDFTSLVGSIRNDAAVKGNYDSSARKAHEAAAAGKVSTDIAEQLGRAGFAQYGAERGFQEDATRASTALAPSLLSGLAELSLAERQQLLREVLGPEGVKNERVGQLLNLLGLFRRGGATVTERPSGASILGGLFKAPSIGGGD